MVFLAYMQPYNNFHCSTSREHRKKSVLISHSMRNSDKAVVANTE